MYHDTLMSAKVPSEDRWVTAQHEGKLILFFPSELRESVKTSHGVSDAVLCRQAVDLDSREVYEQALVFGVALVANIKGGIPEQPVLGRLFKSEKGAWVLAPHTEEELHSAQKWISENNA